MLGGVHPSGGLGEDGLSFGGGGGAIGGGVTQGVWGVVGKLGFDGGVKLGEVMVIGDIEGRDEIGDFLKVSYEGIFELGIWIGEAFDHGGQWSGDALEEFDGGILFGVLDFAG
jgi:hypothetical protein